MKKKTTSPNTSAKTPKAKPTFFRSLLNLITSVDGFFCLLLFIISLALHLIHLSSLGVNNPLLLPLNPDSDLFNSLAQNITQGNIIQQQPFFIGPLYSYFLALFYAIFGESYLPIRYFQIFLSALVPAFAYIVALKTYNRAVAVIAGLAIALYLPFVFFDVLLLPVALEVFLVTLALLLLLGFPQGMRWRYLFAGACIGLLSLSRPNMVILPLFLIVAAFFYREPTKLWQRFKWIIPLFVGMALVILPVTIHNYYLSGELIPITSHGGINFYVGNNPEATGAFHAPQDISATPMELNQAEPKRIAEEELGRELSPNQVSGYWFSKGLEFIRQNPVDFLRLLGRKAVLLSNYYELGLNENYYFHRAQSFVLQLPLLTWGILFAFGLVGIFVGTRRKGNSLVLLAIILTTVSTLLLFIVNDRYRITMVVPLAIYGAYLPVWLAGEFKKRKWWLVSIITVLLIGSLVFCNLSFFGLQPGKNFAPIYYRLGKYNLENGNYQQAVDELSMAGNLRPDDSNSQMLLGITYVKLKEPQEAYRHLLKACSLAPEDPKPLYNLALLLLNYNRKEEALIYLDRCYKLAPEYLPATFAYLQLLIDLGNLPQAETIARELLVKEPKDQNLLFRLGYILYLQGKDQEAREYLQSAGDFFDAHHILGEIYLRAGQGSDALIEFEKERALHPDNSSAIKSLNELLNK
jgi:Flp pilus assembly protein TadD/4-amino-4-deoxy-L-arabinose transferase-like glycosyltransferase